MEKPYKTDRGFVRLDFKDRSNNECSMQQSSLATESCVWLGVNERRMHLTVDMVKMLLPYLEGFVSSAEKG